MTALCFQMAKPLIKSLLHLMEKVSQVGPKADLLVTK